MELNNRFKIYFLKISSIKCNQNYFQKTKTNMDQYLDDI